jgi:hypothetical protein
VIVWHLDHATAWSMLQAGDASKSQPLLLVLKISAILQPSFMAQGLMSCSWIQDVYSAVSAHVEINPQHQVDHYIKLLLPLQLLHHLQPLRGFCTSSCHVEPLNCYCTSSSKHCKLQHYCYCSTYPACNYIAAVTAGTRRNID